MEQFTLVEQPNAETLSQLLRNQQIYESDRIRLLNYSTKIAKGKISITYIRKKFNGKEYGRYYPSDGSILPATYQWRRIRSSLFADTTCDIDIVNCHPVLLEQLFAKVIGKDTPYLRHYIENRDEIIKECKVSQDAIDRYNKENRDSLTKRDYIKTLFTIILYGGSVSTFERQFEITEDEYELPDFFYNFVKETKAITKEIISSEKMVQIAHDYKTKKGDDARDNALLSLILQDLEASIIVKAMEEFKKISKTPITAYTYDGFMVKKIPNIDEVCAKLSEAVGNVTGYKIKFINKPFEAGLSLDKSKPNVLNHHILEGIDDFKRISHKDIYKLVLNTCAWISGGAKAYWVFKSCINGGIDYTTISESKIKTYSIGFSKFAPGKNGKLVEYTLYDHLRKAQPLISYDKVDFIPYTSYGESDPRIFNLFSGFKHQEDPDFKVDEKIIEPILTHIKHIWCVDNEEVFEYIINWLAHIIQRPATRMGTAILLKSTSQGAGKSMICDFISEHVFGEDCSLTLSNSEQIFDRFNSIMRNKIFTVLNEIMDNGAFHALNDRLKALISDKTIVIENKGIDKQKINNFNNFIFLTNNCTPIKVEATDRRFVTLEISNEKAGDHEYFNNLALALNKESGLHLCHMLKQKDISNFVPGRIPSTDLRNELKMNSLDLAMTYIVKIATGEHIVAEKISAADLYENFENWRIANGYRTGITSIKFGKSISQVLVSKSTRVEGKSTRTYNIIPAELNAKCCEKMKVNKLE